MTRQDIKRHGAWKCILAIAGLIDAIAPAHQLYVIFSTGDTYGVSWPMFLAFFFVDVVFTVYGYIDRCRALFYTMALGGALCVANLLAIAWCRW